MNKKIVSIYLPGVLGKNDQLVPNNTPEQPYMVPGIDIVDDDYVVYLSEYSGHIGILSTEADGISDRKKTLTRECNDSTARYAEMVFRGIKRADSTSFYADGETK